MPTNHKCVFLYEYRGLSSVLFVLFGPLFFKYSKFFLVYNFLNIWLSATILMPDIVITKTITTKQFYTGTSITSQQESTYKTTKQDSKTMMKHLTTIY